MRILAIARNTFTESIRQPIFVVMLAIGLALLVINPALSTYTLDDDNKLLLDLGLSTIFVSGLFLAAFTATGVLSREIENKTVLTVISKPVSRPGFIAGKFLGVWAAIGLAFWMWSIVFLLTVRHKVLESINAPYDWPVIALGLLAGFVALFIAVWGNYFYNWVFTSRLSGLLAVTLTIAYVLVLLIDKNWNFQPIATEFRKDEYFLPQVLTALLLVLEGLAIMCAVAIASSTRLGQVMTLVVCFAVFALGLWSDYLFGRHTGVTPAAWVGYVLPPNIQYLWLADALTQRHPISFGYFGFVTLYTALYATAVLSVASALFQTRETG
jgi:ABC-type transport system involved in multi-copper enzyme maturation permease subunit